MYRRKPLRNGRAMTELPLEGQPAAQRMAVTWNIRQEWNSLIISREI